MIDEHLYVSWEEPPEGMDFQMSLGDLFGELEELLFKEKKKEEDYLEIYLKLPFVVSAVIDLQAEGKVVEAPVLPLAVELVRKGYLGDGFEFSLAFFCA